MATIPSQMRTTDVNTNMGAQTAKTEKALMEKIFNMTAAPSQTEMLQLQMEMQQWSLMVQLQSTIQKEISDALKSIVQKI